MGIPFSIFLPFLAPAGSSDDSTPWFLNPFFPGLSCPVPTVEPLIVGQVQQEEERKSTSLQLLFSPTGESVWEQSLGGHASSATPSVGYTALCRLTWELATTKNLASIIGERPQSLNNSVHMHIQTNYNPDVEKLLNLKYACL